MAAERTFLTHLECGWTGDRYAADEIQGLSRAGRPLLARYDLEGISQAVTKDEIAARGGGMWAWAEMLPVADPANRLSLGEALTPLVDLPRLGAAHGGAAPIMKDEGRLPTGSFKARGLGVAVSRAKELGITRIAMPTNGNAGAALAAYGSRAGMETWAFCPDDTPEVNVREIAMQGAHVFRVNGLITDCGKIVGAGKERMGWFDISTLKEPYRIEGKKTMGLELALQFGWDLPDVIFYPTGGGTGLIGMWKAFDELEKMGWIGSKRPKMVAVQAKGCAPIVRAWEKGERTAEFWEGAHTLAAGIRVPAAVGDFLILDAVRESEGWAAAVAEDDIFEMQARVAREEGVLMCPEGAATAVAWAEALADGRLKADETAVLFNCATGLKYPMPPAPAAIDKEDVDWAAIEAA